MNIIVFDLETKLRPGKREDVAAGRADCQWDEKHLLGVSVGVSFSYRTGDFTVYLDDNMPALWDELARADMVTGFNIETFDIPLIYAEIKNIVMDNESVGVTVREREGRVDKDPVLIALDAQLTSIQSKTFDMYHEAKAGAGADTYDKGYRVDDLLRATWGADAAKTGNGAFAPDLYKAGKMGELISYCVADVQRERRLFERFWNVGRLRAAGYKGGAEDFEVRRPWEMTRPATETEKAAMGSGPAFFTRPGPLPFPMDGTPASTPPPSAPYVKPTVVGRASDEI